MTRFQLAFREGGKNHRSEHWFNDEAGETRSAASSSSTGTCTVIRGVEWLLRRDDAGVRMTRFVCTLAVEPADS